MNGQIETIIVKDLPADPERSGAFTYFSLRNNSLVDGPDNNDWDIAFNSITVLTNSGVSGSGQGGGMVLTGENFEKLKVLPTDGWQVDKDGEPALSSPSWYTYTGSEGSPPHTIIPNPGVVLAIRTADNKYVKLQIQSYYMGGARIPRDGEASRYYTFRYQFQPNGSKKFLKYILKKNIRIFNMKHISVNHRRPQFINASKADYTLLSAMLISL